MVPGISVSMRLACVLVAVAVLSSCSKGTGALDGISVASLAPSVRGNARGEKECMTRVMFFESLRSSREGMIAVGTVVMNRVEADEYPDTVCAVVGQKNQFAPGVLTREMNSRALPDVREAAEAVLGGERHPKVRNAKFFHQAGLTFPYTNMHYVLEAGGNAFYEKRSRRGSRPTGLAYAGPAGRPGNALVAAPVPVPEQFPRPHEPADDVFRGDRWPVAAD